VTWAAANAGLGAEATDGPAQGSGSSVNRDRYVKSRIFHSPPPHTKSGEECGQNLLLVPQAQLQQRVRRGAGHPGHSRAQGRSPPEARRGGWNPGSCRTPRPGAAGCRFCWGQDGACPRSPHVAETLVRRENPQATVRCPALPTPPGASRTPSAGGSRSHPQVVQGDQVVPGVATGLRALILSDRRLG
jgi:hypothetical protein